MQRFTTPTIDLNDFADGGGQVLASYPTYAEAQQAIDRLAAASFPVQYSEIVGRDLSLVERVTGRMTPARASATGAVTGAWFGLLTGLVVGLFTFGPAWLGLLVGGLLIGALWGAVFGYLAHRMRSGRHDYASLRTPGGQPLRGDGRQRVRRPRKTAAPPELTRRRQAMFPALTYPTTEAHRYDLYCDARHRHATEIRVREELRRSRRLAVIHRPRSTLTAGH